MVTALLILWLILPFMISLAVLLVVLSGADCCLCSNCSTMTQSGTILCAPWYNDAIATSAVNTTTVVSILAMIKIFPFII